MWGFLVYIITNESMHGMENIKPSMSMSSSPDSCSGGTDFEIRLGVHMSRDFP